MSSLRRQESRIVTCSCSADNATETRYDAAMNTFWEALPQPAIVLAPMADVTDAAFRAMFAKYGPPHVMWTEFVSADGLYHTRALQHMPDAENPLMRDLVFGADERPIVAQLFSAHPSMMEYGASVVAELGFDGIDINMGCPDKSIEKQGAGAALMKDPTRARELIRAAKRAGGGLPVSVKTRVGYNQVELETWLPELLAEEPAAVTIHARTRKEMSLVPARWEHVAHAVALRNELAPNTKILGNGDVQTLEEAYTKAAQTGADGVMIGRGIFGNPWFFSGLTNATHESHAPTVAEKLRALVEHCELFERHCSHKSFAVMKKHFKAYAHGFPGASELRTALMQCEHAHAVEVCLSAWLEHSTV